MPVLSDKLINLLQIGLAYLYQLILLVKRSTTYLGLTSRQNFEDTFYQLLHDKNYDEALVLAQQHDYLDIDLVYKCKWRNSGITVQSINSVLNNIQDKLWAINECVQTVPISYEACRRLITFGLSEANLRLLYELGNEPIIGSPSDKHGAKSLKSTKTKPFREKRPLLDEDIQDKEMEGLIDFGNLNDQQKELCRCRQNLIRYEHALITYETILGDYKTIQQSFDHVFYGEFRQKCPLNNCIDYAHEGDSHAVETCLNFYTDDLSPHILAILSNFPETLSPYQYRNLLPCLRENTTIFQWRPTNTANQIQTRKSDWSSRDRTSTLQSFLDDRVAAYVDEFYGNENAHLRKHLKPLTSDLLTEWFTERALEMESRTLLLSSPVQLLNLGIELNIKNLKVIQSQLKEFYLIIYSVSIETNDVIYFSYSNFKDVSYDQLSSMISALNNEAKYRLLAYALAYCNDPDGKLSVQVLNQVIELRKRDERIQYSYLMQNM